MKLLLTPALLMAVAATPSAPVKFEKDGIRVGSELVTGASMGLKDLGAAPLLVSGSVVESLSGESLTVSLDEKEVALGAGLRLARTAEGYKISTHGMPFTLEAAGKTISADRSAEFKVTEKGFDFGALGALEGTSLAAKVSPGTMTALVAEPVQEEKVQVSPEKADRIAKKVVIRRIFPYDPLIPGRAVDWVSVREVPRATPSGAP